jgi:hypothetical protein
MPDGTSTTSIRRWCVFSEIGVVRRALDAIGWTVTDDLHAARLLEPAAGDGSFVVEAGRRLVQSLRTHGVPLTQEALRDRVLAFEIEASIHALLRHTCSESSRIPLGTRRSLALAAPRQTRASHL